MDTKLQITGFWSILEPVSVIFGSKWIKHLFIFRLVSRSFVQRFLTPLFGVGGFQIVVFSMEGIANIDFSWKSFLRFFGLFCFVFC